MTFPILPAHSCYDKPYQRANPSKPQILRHIPGETMTNRDSKTSRACETDAYSFLEARFAEEEADLGDPHHYDHNSTSKRAELEMKRSILEAVGRSNGPEACEIAEMVERAMVASYITQGRGVS